MTLFKQMALAISTIIIIMLGSVMAINYQSAKKDMLQSLYETTVNNIATLTSDLAEAAEEEAHVTTVIDAAFDSGYYKLIEYHANQTNFAYKQQDIRLPEGVPAWFINFTDLKLESVTADVSAGWNIIGEVKVIGDTGVAYKALYAMFIKLLMLFVFFVVVAHIVLAIMLSYILRPLKQIRHQAEAIMRNEFVIQENEPYTTEFKEVVKGMNAMVLKVEDIFNKGNEAAKRNRELLYNDPVTKLFNKRYLLLKLPDLIAIENRANGGTVMFIAMSGAEVFNQELGRNKADTLFLQLAQIFNDACKGFENGVVSRVNGTEFIIVLPDCEAASSIDIANIIHQHYSELLNSYKLESQSVILDIGMYRYRPNVKIDELLSRAENALMQAKADEVSNTYIYEEKDDANALGEEAWRTIIHESIEKQHFSLKFWSSIDVRTKNMDHKVMTFTIDGGEHKRYFYGDFIAPAINLGLVSKIYIVALKELITKKHDEIRGTLCSIRLSSEFLKDPHSFGELSTLFNTYAKTLDFELSFEVSDNFAIHNTALTQEFVNLFSRYGFKFGINAFTGESTDFAYLKKLNPAFIKADVSFLLDQSKDSMSAIHVITDSLSINIIASFVKTQEELEKLSEIYIYKVQGPITDTLE
jgi:diguanylate cyclase (GGDEF)-like protein